MADPILLDTRTDPDGGTLVTVRGPLTGATVTAVRAKLHPLVVRRAGGPVRVDLAGVNEIDSFGVALFGALLAEATRRGRAFGVVAFSAPTAEAFKRAPAPSEAPPTEPPPRTLETLGEGVAASRAQAFDLLVLTADTVGLCFAGAPRTRRVRRGATAYEAVRIGVDALPIVALISLLIGLVVALQSAYQLARFGANIYVADLIAVSMTREMGPLMTAILLAGRSGSSVAAEIATMQVSQEIDALRTMGLDPVRYIVVPKFLGMTLTMPLLVAFANLAGIVGGFFVSVLYLDIGPLAFWSQVGEALALKDILTGLTKSIAFAWIIVLIASHRGFMAHGGAESVGRMTTASVVASIFWVIVADAAFSMVFYFG